MLDDDRRHILKHLISIKLYLVILSELSLSFQLDLFKFLLSFEIGFLNLLQPFQFLSGQLLCRLSIPVLKLRQFPFDESFFLLALSKFSPHCLLYDVFTLCDELRSWSWRCSTLHLFDTIKVVKRIHSEALCPPLWSNHQIIHLKRVAPALPI